MHISPQDLKWHPKMKPFLFGHRHGSISSTSKRPGGPREGYGVHFKSTTQRGGLVLFVGTKKQAASIVEREAKAASMPYVNNRYLAARSPTSVIVQQIRKLRTSSAGAWRTRQYTKLEQLRCSEEIESLEESSVGSRSLPHSGSRVHPRCPKDRPPSRRPVAAA